ncbi:phosphatidylglycerol lysyltransferase domain-containing protein [Tropicimonas sp. S265A]|uniref:phosphatidylglycerol lysyltransferase domain-containing protein n=1 Tax=Tropicimonas sp. S265A TaxID=3415134 RepID=UPI003C7E0F3D
MTQTPRPDGPDGRRACARLPGLRQILPFGLGALCLWLVAQRCEGVGLAQILTALEALPITAWILAALATAVSFWAIGRYDVVLHRHFRTGHDPREAARAGRAAIAIGQTVGFGLVTGALVRWKWFEPRMSVWDAARLTLAVTVLFLLSWGLVTLVALAFVPVLPGGPLWALAAAAAALALCALSLVQPAGSRMKFRWPSLLAAARLLVLTFVDTVFAALALWVLLPGAVDLGFAPVFAVYLLALGAALITGTPGGVGPFEVTLLAFLPQVAEADLLAACLAFRLIYYALPATVAGASLTWRHLHPMAPEQQPDTTEAMRAALAHPHAELQLARQPEKYFAWSPEHRTGWVTEQADQTLIALFDPLTPAPAATQLAVLAAAAAAADRIPVLYKCDRRMASAARNTGWSVTAVAEDALLDPATFDMSVRGCRQARRKLRKAEQAGVVAKGAHGPLPLTEMAQVARTWAESAGGERGFSMNRFATAPLNAQRVFLARWEGRLVAFATFHVTSTGWALDLVRQTDTAPDGTMHTLIRAALEAAKAAGVTRFSLASVPVQPAPGPGFAKRLQRLLVEKSGGAGLRQFKASFGPRWERRYMAAPSAPAMALGAWDIIVRVRPGRAHHTAGPILPITQPRPASLRAPHEEHENYEIA